MRSGELARLAGVSVRALRHYHAIGLLPEPPRHENGYRDYDAAALLRVLRIRQLASLGFSLERIAAVLDEAEVAQEASSADAQLAELDVQLARQIELLQEQRATVARLREAGVAPHVPERAASVLATLEKVVEMAHDVGFLGWALTEEDRLALGIMAHLGPEEELAEQERVFAAIMARGLLPEYLRVSELVEALPEDASPEVREQAVAACVGFLERVLDCFDARNWLRTNTAYDDIVEGISYGSFNEVQHEVSRRIFAQVTELLEEREAMRRASLDPDATS